MPIGEGADKAARVPVDLADDLSTELSSGLLMAGLFGYPPNGHTMRQSGAEAQGSAIVCAAHER